MESSKNSAYSMLMTVVFYTTGSICALRTTAWLAARTLLPIASHYYYRSYAASPSADSAGGAGGTAAGLFFKLVRAGTAAGHDLFVPVPIGVPHMGAAAAEGSGGSMLLFLFLLLRGVVKLALFSAFVGACSVAAYYFAAAVGSLLARPSLSPIRSLALPLWIAYAHPIAAAAAAAKQDRKSAQSKSHKLSTASHSHSHPAPPSQSVQPPNDAPHTPSTAGTTAGSGSAAAPPDSTVTAPKPAAPSESPWPIAPPKRASATTTKLNPAAPVFTPSTPAAQRLDPTARAFTSRGWGGEGKDSAPPSPADSVGPATPSPVRSAFAFAARVAARGRSSGGDGGKQGLPVGVGRMRVVRPEEVVISERRAGEVFVFF
ncbi:hypothetical protein BJV78DRAFT_227077 [Lactifluus subvellereus]|nr:hypothetical protein BJV78DRAFT_227077 [Lactifluus subvellereus]